jgi:hypothetical protein
LDPIELPIDFIGYIDFHHHANLGWTKHQSILQRASLTGIAVRFEAVSGLDSRQRVVSDKTSSPKAKTH